MSAKKDKKNDSGATESNKTEMVEKNNISYVNNSSTSDDDRTRLEEIKFLNHSVKLSPGVSKEALRASFIMNRNDWQDKTGYAALRDSVAAGHIHQLEDDETGLKDIVCLDFDFWDKSAKAAIANAITIDEIKNIPTVAKYGNFIQPSISYASDHQNSHVYVVLSRPVTAQESNLITKGIVEAIKSDLRCTAKSPESDFGIDSCVANNSKQVIFASNADIIDINHLCVADVSELLQISKEFDVKVSKGKKGRPVIDKTTEVKKVTSTSVPIKKMTPGIVNAVTTKENPTITDKVLEHLYEHLFVSRFESDPRKLYGMHAEQIEWNARVTEGESELLRVEGVNPFSPTNNSGSSFMVIYEENLLPRFWDKSGNFDATHQSGYSSNQGTYLDYYFYVQQRFFDKFPGVSRGDDGSLPKGFFKQLVYDVCTTFDLPEFDWNCLEIEVDDLIQEVFEWGKDRIYYLGKDCYFYFTGDVWRIGVDFPHVYGFAFKNHVYDVYGDRMVFERKGKKKIVTRICDIDWTKLQRKIKHEYTMSSHEIPNDLIYDYVPMANGVYNVKEQKLEPNNGQSFNRYTIPWGYSPESIKLETITVLEEYLCELVQSQIGGRILFIWLMLNCQRKAIDSSRALCIYGASGKGKTTYLMLIKKLLNGCFVPNGNDKSVSNTHGYAGQPDLDLLLGRNAHASVQLEGKTSILVPELTNSSHTGDEVSFFKRYLGNESDRSIVYNQKFEVSRESLHNFGFTMDNEEMPKITASVAGNYRRIIFVNVPKDSPGCRDFHTKYLSIIEDDLEGIFNYALTLDTSELIKELNDLADGKEIKEKVTEVRQENDSIYQFVSEFVEVTEEIEAKVSFSALYKVLELNNGSGKYSSTRIRKRSFINDVLKCLDDPMYDMSWEGEHTQTVFKCKVLGKNERGFITGIKLTDEALRSIGSYDSSTEKDL
jgi:phage/plasmid-associated DNA primase